MSAEVLGGFRAEKKKKKNNEKNNFKTMTRDCKKATLVGALLDKSSLLISI